MPDLSNLDKEAFLFTPNKIGDFWEANETNRRDHFSKRFRRVVKEQFHLNEDYGIYSFRHTFISKLYRKIRKEASPFEAKSNLSNAQLYFALYSSGSTKTSQLATLSTEWQRFEFENLTTGYTLDAGYLRFPSSGDSGTVYYIRRMQVEQKTHATPFVDGTRSSTQGLLDRTGNTTIDISNASFDSNAQMTFDGTDDYADVSATDLFQPQNTTDGFTVEYVYRPEANTSVVPVGNLDSTNGWFQAPISNGSLGAYLYFSTDGVVLSTDSSYAINSGIIGKYQHIVMVLKWSDTANSFIMVNGEDKTASKATASKYTVSGSANPALRIGKRGGSIWPANGQMPLIKIYNRALTAAEVLQNFNATKSRFGL